MDQNTVLQFIEETGYRTLPEIREQFSKEDPEILNSVLMFLVDRRHIRKASFQAPHGREDLYHTAPQ